MATKSILKDVRFKDRKLCRGFATALESAKGCRAKAKRCACSIDFRRVRSE